MTNKILGFLAAAILAMVLLAAAINDASAQEFNCYQRTIEQAAELLYNDYGEIPFSKMTDGDKGSLYTFVNPATGTWTTLYSLGNKTCALGAGDTYEVGPVIGGQGA